MVTQNHTAQDDSKHPIGIAARYSGLSAEVIRAWERRYQIIKPRRNDNGRRIYSDADIEKLTLLAKAVKAGRRIGDIVAYDEKQLEKIIEEDEKLSFKHSPKQKRQNTALVMEYFDFCLDAIINFDLYTLINVLDKAEVSLSTIFFIEDLINPLISHIREECRRGVMNNTNRNWFLSAITGYLIHLSGQQHNHRHQKLISYATDSDFDLIALKATATANALGWNTLYLSQSAQPEEVVDVFNFLNANLLIITASPSSVYDDVPNQFRKIRALLPNIPIIAQVTGSPLPVIREINAIYCGSLQQLQLELNRLENQ